VWDRRLTASSRIRVPGRARRRSPASPRRCGHARWRDRRDCCGRDPEAPPADPRLLDRRDDAGALVTGRFRGDLLCRSDEHLVSAGDGLPLRGNRASRRRSLRLRAGPRAHDRLGDVGGVRIRLCEAGAGRVHPPSRSRHGRRDRASALPRIRAPAPTRPDACLRVNPSAGVDIHQPLLASASSPLRLLARRCCSGSSPTRSRSPSAGGRRPPACPWFVNGAVSARRRLTAPCSP
jgi:hypothetical protein